MSRLDTSTTALAVRLADHTDAEALLRLAALDSAAVPAGPMLLGILDGCTLVGFALDSGAVIADPFAPTEDLVALVRERADRLARPTPAATRRWWRRTMLHSVVGRA